MNISKNKIVKTSGALLATSALAGTTAFLTTRFLVLLRNTTADYNIHAWVAFLMVQ